MHPRTSDPPIPFGLPPPPSPLSSTHKHHTSVLYCGKKRLLSLIFFLPIFLSLSRQCSVTAAPHNLFGSGRTMLQWKGTQGQIRLLSPLIFSYFSVCSYSVAQSSATVTFFYLPRLLCKKIATTSTAPFCYCRFSLCRLLLWLNM